MSPYEPLPSDLPPQLAGVLERCLALIDAARQPAFVAVGQFDDYFNEHPDEADALRGIQAPLGAYKDRCGLQVAPTDALAVLAEV